MYRTVIEGIIGGSDSRIFLAACKAAPNGRCVRKNEHTCMYLGGCVDPGASLAGGFAAIVCEAKVPNLDMGRGVTTFHQYVLGLDIPMYGLFVHMFKRL